QERTDLLRLQADALVRHYAGDDDLAEGLVRHADGLRDLDPGVAGQCLVDLAGRHVGAAGLDDVGEPALPEEPALRVEVAAVAGAEEALVVERLVQRRAEVAQYERGALDADLAALAARDHRAGQRVGDLEGHAGQRLAAAAAVHLRRGAGRIAGGDREGLGAAVGVPRLGPATRHAGMPPG